MKYITKQELIELKKACRDAFEVKEKSYKKLFLEDYEQAYLINKILLKIMEQVEYNVLRREDCGMPINNSWIENITLKNGEAISERYLDRSQEAFEIIKKDLFEELENLKLNPKFDNYQTIYVPINAIRKFCNYDQLKILK